MTGLYGETYRSYQDALSEFLASYREMFVYFRDHSEAIQQNVFADKSEYERLYARFASALKKQNKAYLEHVDFIKKYVKEHPSMADALKEIIPQPTV
jgi:hypothetical protein